MMATALHPEFCLGHVPSKFQKGIYERIKREAAKSQQQEDVQLEIPSTSTEVQSLTQANFESALGGKRAAPSAASRFQLHCHEPKLPRIAASVEDLQIQGYLTERKPPTDWKRALETIPDCLRELYVTSNTPMPSSAGSERLFSLAGRIFSPLRSRLQDKNFESLVFLRSNWELLDE